MFLFIGVRILCFVEVLLGRLDLIFVMKSLGSLWVSKKSFILLYRG